MILKQKILVGAATLVGMGIGSVGLGVAHAQTNTTSTPAVQGPAAQSVVNSSSADPAETATSAESDGPGGHQDANGVDVQYGSQSGPDTGGSDISGN